MYNMDAPLRRGGARSLGAVESVATIYTWMPSYSARASIRARLHYRDSREC